MFGDRRGDFSRVRPDEVAHYDRIHMQQGRVHLDSDWNAQADMLDRRMEAVVRDLVGSEGAPARTPGYGIFAFDSFVLGGQSRIEVRLPEEHLAEDPFAEQHLVGQQETLQHRRPTLEISLRCDSECWAYRPPRDSASGVIPLQLSRESALLESPAAAVAIPPGQTVLLALGSGPGHPLWLDRCRVVEFSPASRTPTTLELSNGFEIRLGADVRLEFFEIRLWSFDLRQRATPGAPDPDLLLPPETLSRLVQPAPSTGIPRLLGFWRGQDDSRDPSLASRARRLRAYGLGHATAEVHGESCRPRLQLGVTPGRFYAHGVTCELHRGVPFSAQPDLPTAPPPTPRAERSSSYLLYLDLWRRSVNTLGDSALSEVALGGLDTGVMERTLAQVKWLPLPPNKGAFESAWQGWTADAHTRHAAMRIDPVDGAPGTDNILYRIEVHYGGFCADSSWTQTRGWRVRWQEKKSKGNRSKVGTWVQPQGYLARRWPWSVGQPLELQSAQGRTWRVEVLELRREGWFRVVGLLGSEEPCEGYVRPVAAFKWAPNNACVVRAVLEVKRLEGSASFRLGPWLGLKGAVEKGAFFELVDDHDTLHGIPNPLWTLARPETSDDFGNSETPRTSEWWHLKSSQPRVDPDLLGRNPYLRVWGQTRGGDDELLDTGVILIQGPGPVIIDGRFEVQFAEQGEYRHGDFWWVEVRGNRLHWPTESSDRAVYRPPEGVEHRYARLATLSVSPDGGLQVDDLRDTFNACLDGQVGKVGPQTMQGPLTVHGEIHGTGMVVRPPGRVTADLEGRLLSEGIVEGHNIAQGAVTANHLAPEVGWIPAGFSILGPGPEAPSGYEATGSDLHLYHDRSSWVDRLRLPVSGSTTLRLAAVGTAAVGTVLVAISGAGDVWHVDSATGRVEPGADWRQPSRHFAIAVLEQKIHLLGGLDSVGRPTESHWVYNPAAGSWSMDEPLSSPRAALAAVGWKGRLHVVGGLERTWWGLRPVVDHEVFEPSNASNAWQPRRSLPLALAHTGFAHTHLGLHVAGGWHRGLCRCRAIAGHWLYDDATDLWAARAPLPSPLQRHALVGTSQDLFTLGGRGREVATAGHYRYDTRCDHWLPQTPLHVPLASPGAAAVGECLYVVGAAAADGGVLLESRQVATHQYIYRKQPLNGSSASTDPQEANPCASKPSVDA